MKKTIVMLVVVVMLLSTSVMVLAGKTPIPSQNSKANAIKSGLEMSKTPPPTQSFAVNADLNCVVGALALLHPGIFTTENKTLKITKDQEDKIKAITTTTTAELQKLKEKLKAQNLELREALLADKYDNAKITKLVQSSTETENALVVTEMQAWSQIRAILTTEQVKILRDGLNRHKPSSISPFPGVNIHPEQQGAPVIKPNTVRSNVIKPSGDLPN